MYVSHHMSYILIIQLCSRFTYHSFYIHSDDSLCLTHTQEQRLRQWSLPSKFDPKLIISSNPTHPAYHTQFSVLAFSWSKLVHIFKPTPFPSMAFITL